MSEPFVGEIRMFAGTYAPRGWAFCDGQLMNINQYTTLFSIMGTTYGGDGRTTFGLPDLRGRAPIHAGTGPGLSARHPGQKLGAETVRLQSSHMPRHTHRAYGTSHAPDNPSPKYGMLAASDSDQSMKIYNRSLATPDAPMHTRAISRAGGGQAHDNMQPSMCIHFIIALEGLYPPRS